VALDGWGCRFFDGYGFVAGCVAGHGCGLHLFDEGDEAGEALFTSGLVAGDGVIGIFAGAHEAVACAVVGDGIVLFARGFHGISGGGNSGADTGVVASIEAVDRSGDGGDVRRTGAVEDEGGGEVFAMSCKGKRFAAAPTEADDGDFSIAGGDFLAIVCCGVEVCVDDRCVEAGDRFGGGVHAWEGVGAAAIWAEAGEKVGSYDDESLPGEFVGHLLGPVAEAEDFVDEDDDRGFGFDLGVDDEGLDGAVAVLEGDVLVMARRGVKAGFGPVLRLQRRGGEGKDQSGGEELERVAHGYRHGEESSTKRAARTRWRGRFLPRRRWRVRHFYTWLMTKFHLRIATTEDVAGIRGLIDASVRGLQAGDYSARQIEGALATVFTVDSRLIADGTYFVALTEDEELAGCGGWSFRKTLYGGDHQVEEIVPDRLDPAVDAAKVRAIFVHPKFARQGLGSMILDAAESAAIKEGFLRFEMGSTLTGVPLYRLSGYREMGRIAVPVGNGERIVVVRMLKEARHPH